MLVALLMMITIVTGPVSHADEQLHISWPEHGYIFRINNARPGDIISRTIVISNNNSKNMSYFFRVRITTDENRISKVLWVKLSQHNEVIFEGSLKNLADKANGIPMEQLRDKNGESLTISIIFDHNAGNVFQRSAMSFSAEVGALRAMLVQEERRNEKAHNKHESIWEQCMKYIKTAEDKIKKVSVRPR